MTLQKIWKLKGFGGSEQLEFSQAENPNASEDKVNIKNETIGLNYSDIYLRTT